MAHHSDVFANLITRVRSGASHDISGFRGAARAMFSARLSSAMAGNILFILPRDEHLEPFARDMALFTGEDVLIYPSFEIPPYTPLSPDPATISSRISTLTRLVNNSGDRLVITSVEALLRRIVPASALNSRSELIMAGEDVDREELVRSLIHSGYEPCSLVKQVGDMAVRGSVLDIYTPPADGSLEGPLRLDFFGDTLESIRVFDPLTQRSLRELEEAILLPCSDILFPKEEEQAAWKEHLYETIEALDWSREAGRYISDQLGSQMRFAGVEFFLPLIYSQPQTLFDFLGAKPVVVQIEPSAIRQQMLLVHDRIRANYHEATERNIAAIPPEKLFIQEGEFNTLLAGNTNIRLSVLPDPDAEGEVLEVKTGSHALLKQEIELQRRKRGIVAPLADRLIAWAEKGEGAVLTCNSSRQVAHLREMLGSYHLRPVQAEAPLSPEALGEIVRDKHLVLVEHPLSEGFDLVGEKLHFISAGELFGEKRLGPGKRGVKKREDIDPVQVDSLSLDDVVVHRDHGLGLFKGLINMEFAGSRGDFMQVEYKGGDKLYVPVDRLHWVSKYQGLTDQLPKLDKLGTDRWRSAKKKVTDAVLEVAHELIEIYAKRAMEQGKRFSPPGSLYEELEESFPYDETSGQHKAITEVLDDLTSDRPMDRLVCGDVGYGKTEVAVRAAFKVIEDGDQVAMLVPTTVLAEQHAATFRERFGSLPVKVACINRFRTTAQQRKILTELKAGEIDLVVGTHRLLSKDVQFNKLGLLIIDEEHRFGVAHKEKTKKLRAQVDVLTLTATPIPRTLQMSLLGIRDLSVISTPPRMRRSVKTFLARHDELVIREAVVRELQRNGQLYFVHNRVRSIHRVAGEIEKLVPNARIAVAHGQMTGHQLEEIMVKFINHEVDVLVCTTIIESGLDIPNANTIIINRADQLGLADIYQLRGRVGRSSRQSFAYLLVPSLDSLTKDAKERLRALMDCNELGGGFKLAMNDLQIRGGGNLLGVSQSGHIAAVGYDLYLELLQDTVAELQKKAKEDEGKATPAIDPEINLKVAAFLPEDYVADAGQRYQLYRRISGAAISSPEQLDDLRTEVEDRFGPLPAQADMLFKVVSLKYDVARMGVSKLEQAPNAVVFSFSEQSTIKPERILSFMQQGGKKNKKETIRFTPDQRLVVPFTPQQELFAHIGSVMQYLLKED